MWFHKALIRVQEQTTTITRHPALFRRLVEGRRWTCAVVISQHCYLGIRPYTYWHVSSITCIWMVAASYLIKTDGHSRWGAVFHRAFHSWQANLSINNCSTVTKSDLHPSHLIIFHPPLSLGLKKAAGWAVSTFSNKERRLQTGV